jgi:hypothetical protein
MKAGFFMGLPFCYFAYSNLTHDNYKSRYCLYANDSGIRTAIGYNCIAGCGL